MTTSRSLPALIAVLLLTVCRAESAPAAPEAALPSLVRAEVRGAAPVRQIAAAEDGLYLVDEAGKLLHLGPSGQTEALAEGFAHWLPMWGVSWAIAYPTILIIMPIAQKLVGKIVAKAN